MPIAKNDEAGGDSKPPAKRRPGRPRKLPKTTAADKLRAMAEGTPPAEPVDAPPPSIDPEPGVTLNKDGTPRKKPGRKAGGGSARVPSNVKALLKNDALALPMMRGLYAAPFNGAAAVTGVKEAIPTKARLDSGADALLLVARLYTGEWMKYLPVFALAIHFGTDAALTTKTIMAAKKAQKPQIENLDEPNADEGPIS